MDLDKMLRVDSYLLLGVITENNWRCFLLWPQCR